MCVVLWFYIPFNLYMYIYTRVHSEFLIYMISNGILRTQIYVTEFDKTRLRRTKLC